MKKFYLILLLFTCAVMTAQIDNFKIKNLEVNTEYSDFGTAYLGDTTAVYASSKTIDKTIRKKIWKHNGQPYLELYIGNLSEDGQISNSKNFSKVINTRYHESNIIFSKDNKTVYFTRDNTTNGKKLQRAKEGKDKKWVTLQLYRATMTDNGYYTEVTPMPFNNINYSTGHPTLNKEENKLYFTSDMPNGYGKTDIYVVDIFKTDSVITYSKPRNMGAAINTSGKEMFPHVTENGNLYFSSDGHMSDFGGLDVYESKKENGVFTKAQNLGGPINSNKDDFALVYQRGKKTGHFSSNRDEGKGDDDIYSFEDLRKESVKSVVCSQTVNGVVREKASGALLPKTIVTLYKDGKKVESVVVGNDAAFEFKVACSANYKVVGEKKTYISDQDEFTTTSKADLALDLGLNLEDTDFATTGGKLLVKIDPIYFDLNKSDIRMDAAIELAKVIRVMKKYPGIIIEGGSHTDSRASNSYNEALSSRRAKSTVAYIIEKGGISSSRISARGYGERQLINNCADGVRCSEIEHQLNRRTEFVIKNPEVLNR